MKTAYYICENRYVSNNSMYSIFRAKYYYGTYTINSEINKRADTELQIS